MAKAAVTHFEPEALEQAQAMLDAKQTKKAICDFLGIAYNTKRLGTILENFARSKEADKELRKRKRATACTSEELASIISDYLLGMSFKDLSERYYRSPAYIKHKIELAGGLLRHTGIADPLNAPTFPDEGLLLDPDFKERVETKYTEKTRKDWETIVAAKGAGLREILSATSKFPEQQALRQDGELVWVPGYQCLGEVIKEIPSKTDRAYRVLLLDEGKQMKIHVPYWDICSLRHLESMGVDVASLGNYVKNTEVTQLLNEALRAAKKAI
jgi:hypothetical protein